MCPSTCIKIKSRPEFVILFNGIQETQLAFELHKDYFHHDKILPGSHIPSVHHLVELCKMLCRLRNYLDKRLDVSRFHSRPYTC